jgi:hypothetical protein
MIRLDTCYVYCLLSHAMMHCCNSAQSTKHRDRREEDESREERGMCFTMLDA